MNFIRRVILTLVFAIILMPEVSVMAQNSDYFLHTVERGQSLYSIASMYHVGIDHIISLNPGCEKQIRTGETLRIPQATGNTGSNAQGVRFHTIRSGETLYRLTTLYGVSASDICKANPGLSAKNFRSGEVIVIPAQSSSQKPENIQEQKAEESEETPTSPCREMHKVQRGETIFSISRQYNISEKELTDANPELKKGKLKRGKFLCIPHKRTPSAHKKPNSSSVAANPPSNEELFNKNKQQKQVLKNIKAALMLPFQLDAASGEQTLMVEYYEGLLLAIDSLKKQNVDITLHVYDTGGKDKSVEPLLAKPEMKQMDIIFGPGHTEHIKPVSEFAKKHNIRLVIPFTSKDSEVFNNPLIYQINTPQSYLFSQVHKLFADQFGTTHNILFVESEDGKSKDEYIRLMKEELDARGMSHRTIPMPASTEDLTSVLDSIRPNIIVPTSGTNITLIKLLPVLQTVIRVENNPYEIHTFGYPEWQKYTDDHLQAFYEVDSYFYSSFYTNNLLPASIAFIKKFRYWYNEEMINTFPKYGMLGFDTGYFFLKGLSRYGSNLEENLNKMDLHPVQTGFHFERVNNWGGFINKKVFLIHMSRNHELVKLEFEQ